MYSFSYPAKSYSEFPAVSATEMQAIYDRMTAASPDVFFQMMESAGEAVAEIVDCYAPGYCPKVMVLAGMGNNGRVALVAARNLAERGVDLQVVLPGCPGNLKSAPAKQLKILRRSYPDIPVNDSSSIHGNTCSLSASDIIIDGLLGYSITDVPREPVSALIRSANNACAPTISVDLPSGLHPDSGEPASPTILAAATVTLALPKCGFQNTSAAPYLGEIYLADTGIPDEVMTAVLGRCIATKRDYSLIYLNNKPGRQKAGNSTPIPSQ